MKICRRFSFDAAHRLPRHDGKCARPHGHTYILEVEIKGEASSASSCSSQGMVIDFKFLKSLVDFEILAVCDHRDLNHAVSHYGVRHNCEIENITTAENLVALFVQALGSAIERVGLGDVVHLSRLRLNETQDSWAEWDCNVNIEGQLEYLTGRVQCRSK